MNIYAKYYRNEQFNTSGWHLVMHKSGRKKPCLENAIRDDDFWRKGRLLIKNRADLFKKTKDVSRDAYGNIYCFIPEYSWNGSVEGY